MKAIVPVGLLSPNNVAVSVNRSPALKATPGPAFVLSVGVGVGTGVGVGVAAAAAAITTPRVPGLPS